jgi:hypothetical protein
MGMMIAAGMAELLSGRPMSGFPWALTPLYKLFDPVDLLEGVEETDVSSPRSVTGGGASKKTMVPHLVEERARAGAGRNALAEATYTEFSPWCRNVVPILASKRPWPRCR